MVTRGVGSAFNSPGVDDAVGYIDRCPPERVSLGGPPCLQICDTVAGLVTTSVRRSFTREGGAFSSGRVTTLTITEHCQLGGQSAVDL